MFRITCYELFTGKIILTEKALKVWKEVVEVQRKERQKKQHKQVMWNKVNTLLNEYQDSKKWTRK